MKKPELYKANARNRLLAVDKSLLWIAEGLFHSILCFFAFYLLWKDMIGHPGNNLDMLSFGIAVYSTIIVVVNLRLLIHAKFWNVVLVSTVALSILFYFGFTFAIHAMPSGYKISFIIHEMYKVIYHTLCLGGSGGIWLTSLLVIFVAMLPYLIIEPIHQQFSSFKDRKMEYHNQAFSYL